MSELKEKLEAIKLNAEEALALIEGGAEATEAGETAAVEISTVEDIEGMGKDDLQATAAAWGVEEGSMPKSVKTLKRVLVAVAKMYHAGQADDDDADDYKEFAGWIGLTAEDDDWANAVFQYMQQDAEDGGDEAGGEAATGEAAGEDEVDPAVESITDEMIEAHNKAADEELPDGEGEAAPALVELLRDDEGTVAEWGVPYVKNEDGYCCGLKLADVEGEELQGDCRVTGKRFEFDPESGEFSEVEKPKAKKKAVAKKPGLRKLGKK